MRRLRTWLIVAAGAVVPASAGGAWLLDPGVRLALEERYDDDPILGGDAPGQLVSKLSPQLALELKAPTFTSSSAYAVDLALRHGTASSSLDHRGHLEARARLSPVSSLGASASIWRVEDPTSLPRLGMARVLAPVLYAEGDLGFDARASERLSWRAGVRSEVARIDEPGRPVGTVLSPMLSGRYRISPLGEAGLDLRAQRFSLGADAAHAASVAPGYGLRLARRSSLYLRVGPTFFLAPGEEIRAVPTFGAALSSEWERAALGLTLGHEIVGASGLAPALWADFASLALERRMSGHTKARLGASAFRNGAAPGEAWPVVERGGDVSSGYRVGALVEWTVSRAVSLEISADRLGQLGAVALARNVVAVRVVIAPW